MNVRWFRFIVGLWVLSFLLGAAPRYEGIWVLNDLPDDNMVVSFPNSTLLGASLAVAPTGTDVVSATVVARLELNGKGFQGAHLNASVTLVDSTVQVRCLVDGDVVALFQGIGTYTESIHVDHPMSELQFDVAALSAPAAGWSVLFDGIVFDKDGWSVAYSPDCAGLEARIDAPDTIRLGVDSDWAELGWPLSGSVTTILRPPGGVTALDLMFRQTLPPGVFLARVGLDGEPIRLIESGPFAPESITKPDILGEQLELSLTVVQPVSAVEGWEGVFDNIIAVQADLSDTDTVETSTDMVVGQNDPDTTSSDSSTTPSSDQDSGCRMIRSSTTVLPPLLALVLFGMAAFLHRRFRARRFR